MADNSSKHSYKKFRQLQTYSYRTNEKGAALIVVLLFLILIMLAGVIAVRRSTTDLRTATSDQINTLLLQSSDSANQKLESMVNGSSTSQEYKDVMSVSGVFGHFLLDPDNQGHEFIYCYNPRTKQYLTSNATILMQNADGTLGKWNSLDNGVCDFNKPSGFTSARNTLVTQMSVSTPPVDNDNLFQHVVIGKEIENRSSKKFKFDIKAASILPSFNTPVDSGGTSCLTQSSRVSASGTIPLLTCLHNARTPTKMLYEQADVANESSSIKCIDYGRGATALAEGC